MKTTKSFLLLAASALAMVACKQSDKAPAATKETTATTEAPAANKPLVGKVETASFHIEGMTCAVMCAAKIQSELSAMDGVRKATVDFDKKSATVEYDNGVLTPQKLTEKVESVADGKTYKVSEMKTTADHAMLYIGQQDKNKKSDKKAAKKDSKDSKANAKATKPACCAAKKHCTEGSM